MWTARTSARCCSPFSSGGVARPARPDLPNSSCRGPPASPACMSHTPVPHVLFAGRSARASRHSDVAPALPTHPPRPPTSRLVMPLDALQLAATKPVRPSRYLSLYRLTYPVRPSGTGRNSSLRGACTWPYRRCTRYTDAGNALRDASAALGCAAKHRCRPFRPVLRRSFRQLRTQARLLMACRWSAVGWCGGRTAKPTWRRCCGESSWRPAATRCRWAARTRAYTHTCS
jgi:hypothetical protein